MAEPGSQRRANDANTNRIFAIFIGGRAVCNPRGDASDRIFNSERGNCCSQITEVKQRLLGTCAPKTWKKTSRGI